MIGCYFIAFEHQSNKDKPCASKCHHFCHPFDSHNYCPTCREVGKGDDDPCITFISPCEICASFTEEQQTKITHRKRYVKRDKKSDKNDEDAELLGDNSVESFGVRRQSSKLLPNVSLHPCLALNLLLSRRYL